MIDLILSEPWVISANFHDGAVVAAYPYNDYKDDNTQEGLHQTPDDEFFKHLASACRQPWNHGQQVGSTSPLQSTYVSILGLAASGLSLMVG